MSPAGLRAGIEGGREEMRDTVATRLSDGGHSLDGAALPLVRPALLGASGRLSGGRSGRVP